jgi:uncharacterized SAM-binding protein YcdF (DUF218 family)
MGMWLDVGEEPCPVDAVVVLSGEPNTRPFVAAALVRVGLADRAIIPQARRGVEVIEERAFADDYVVRKVLLARGVSQEKIVLLEGANLSTFDDARAVAKWLAGEHATSLAVVTNDFHTRRARWVFERVLAGSPVRLVMISAPSDDFRPQRWWHVASGLNAYTSEYVKLLAYWLRYGNGAYWVAAIAIACIVATALVRRLARKKSPPHAV